MVTIDDVREAAERLRGAVYETPLLRLDRKALEPTLSVFVKAENVQRTGSFKFRGALNFVARASESRTLSGLSAVSSGNHAYAVATVASELHLPCLALVPSDCSEEKVANLTTTSATIRTYDAQTNERTARLRALSSSQGLMVVPSADDETIIAGAGTVALEMLAEAPTLDSLLAPVGGGGLIAGCATVARALSPTIQVIGVEPIGCDDTLRSLEAGRRVQIVPTATIADGQRHKIPDAVPFEIIRRFVDRILVVSDADVAAAMRYLSQNLGLIAEPSGAAAFAALLSQPDQIPGRRVGVIVSGGNVSRERFDRLTDRRA